MVDVLYGMVRERADEWMVEPRVKWPSAHATEFPQEELYACQVGEGPRADIVITDVWEGVEWRISWRRLIALAISEGLEDRGAFKFGVEPLGPKV